jgi:hypothetical protein
VFKKYICDNYIIVYILQIITFKIDPRLETPPEGFTNIKNRIEPIEKSLYVYACDDDEYELNGTNTYNALFSEHFCSPGCWLIGMQIPCQTKPKKTTNDTYVEHCTVVIYTVRKLGKITTTQVLKKFEITQTVEYDSGPVDILFPEACNRCTAPRLTLYITVIPHTNGLYKFVNPGTTQGANMEFLGHENVTLTKDTSNIKFIITVACKRKWNGNSCATHNDTALLGMIF